MVGLTRSNLVQSLSTQDITPDVAMGIICEITTPTQAKEILSKYPDFISSRP